MDNILNWSTVISIIGLLVVLTNLIVQVLKPLIWGRIPTNLLVVTVSMALTLVTFFAYCQIHAIPITWYMAFAAVVLGMLVAYSAMFGFDKLKEALSQIEK